MRISIDLQDCNFNETLVSMVQTYDWLLLQDQPKLKISKTYNQYSQTFIIQHNFYMKTVSQKQLTEHVGLVKWQETKQLQKFNLLTIHSLLLDSNPKFIQLKGVVDDYNKQNEKTVGRKHLKEQYVQKIFQMLSQMIIIPNYQNQLQFLNKVYAWTFKMDLLSNEQFNGKQSRPTTASTRRRPFSAYSRPKSGVTTKTTLIKQLQMQQLKPTNKIFSFVDYDKLQPGNIQFYNGMRTLHPQEQITKKKLKEYQRKIFYQEQQDSDLEIIDLDKQKQKTDKRFVYKSKLQINEPEPQELPQQQNQQNLQQNNQQNVGEEGAQIGIGEGNDEDVNIDDIPIEGQELQQQKEIIDKLRPKFKAFVKNETDLQKLKDNYQSGINQIRNQRNQMVKKFKQDSELRNNANLWAKQKSRTQRQKKRRAQSARMITKRIGIANNQQKKTLNENENVNQINLSNVPVTEIGVVRPKTAFISFNPNNRKQIIENCFMTSKLNSHITLQPKTEFSDNKYMRITSCAQRPKKKTFQQILREAQQRVIGQTEQELVNMKQTFAKNKVSFQANRIAKSITYHNGAQKDQQFSGQITGMTLPKNPFIKVTKKKKKKKKK